MRLGFGQFFVAFFDGYTIVLKTFSVLPLLICADRRAGYPWFARDSGVSSKTDSNVIGAD